jgi:tripeptide aminopeptidase
MGSCDGHGRRAHYVMITKESKIDALKDLLLALGVKRVYWREQRNGYHLPLLLPREELLPLAERLSHVDKNWLGKGEDKVKENLFYHLLEELLMIPGESGNEERIRQMVVTKLTRFVDHLTVDHAS